MQLFALDKNGQQVAAAQACRHHLYYCPECGRPLTLRGGRRYRKHYYHSRQRGDCLQNGKSLTHLHIQKWIMDQLPSNEAFFEYRFAPIRRIADVYWPKQRLIFEVQFSNTTAREALTRNRDYGSLGLTVVWILHQRHFRHQTEAEEALYGQPVYYTQMRPGGPGLIYDQLTRGSPKLPICIDRPLGKPALPSGRWHPALQRRILYFAGDASDAACGPNPPPFLQRESRIQSLRKLLQHLRLAISDKVHR